MRTSAELVEELGIKATSHAMLRYPGERTLYALAMVRANVHVQVYLVRADAAGRPTAEDGLRDLIEAAQVASRGVEDLSRLVEGHVDRRKMELLFRGVMVSVGPLWKLLGNEDLYESVVSGSSTSACAKEL